MTTRNSDCPNPLHNWPTPSSFLAASDMAERRLDTGWDNRRCPDCGIWGWEPGRLTDDDQITLLPKDPSADK